MKKPIKIILFSALCIFLVVVSVGGFLFYRNIHLPMPKVQNEGIKVACIGDSITYGAGVLWSRARDSYPAQLQQMLGDEYQVVNYGASGRTLQEEGDTPYRKTVFIEHSQNIAPDIVVIMLGTNDSKPFNWNAERYEEQYIKLVQSYQSLEKKPQIFLVAPPAAFIKDGEDKVVYNIDQNVIENQIHDIVQHVAEQTGATFIDMFEVTKDHPEYFMDGVHGNQNGYKVIANTICSDLVKK